MNESTPGVRQARIRAEGFEATLERALVHPSTSIAHLISMVGPREAVRAIWAKGIGGYGDVRLEEDGRVSRVRASDVVMRQSKLPCGATHLLVASKAVLEGEVLIARSGEELEERVWRSILRICPTPLHPTWRGFVLGAITIHPLEAFGDVRGAWLEGVNSLGARVRECVKEGSLCA